MQFKRNAHYSLFRVWELGVSFLGPLSCQYSRTTKIMLSISLEIRTPDPEILLCCSHLCGVKCLPGIPSAFPVLFLGPTLRFQEVKIGVGVRPFAKMTCGEKGIIDPTTLHLCAIKFVTNAVVIGRGGEAVFLILKREISGDSRKRHRFAVFLGQLVCSA